ncbi:limbic system-associated membrane protein-like protein [Willisornis vidua]|uniref:Limbic system-associated membrane protein-like protein n=1 Tax=Willisornis vidua TaxID=1566151 RepID=A0ABQ9DL79_9PASS|nr:limbic system-associated membrane protein-like protein [Willisornis vidua]
MEDLCPELTKLELCIFVLQAERALGVCYVEDRSSKVAWLNRSGIIFAGEDKWSLDPRVELEKRNPLEYSLRIQKVDVYDEGSYTCSVQTQHHPKTSQVYLIVQGNWKLGEPALSYLSACIYGIAETNHIKGFTDYWHGWNVAMQHRLWLVILVGS